MEVIGETGLFRLFADCHVAEADVIDGRGYVEDLFTADSAHKRPEIFSVLFFDFAGNGKTRKLLLRMNFNIGIRFIVFQENIVLGLVFFDEIVFQPQRVDFRLGDNVVKVRDMLHHRGDLLGLFGAVKILAHSVFKHARLSDVDDDSVLVQHDIHARTVGKKFQFFL